MICPVDGGGVSEPRTLHFHLQVECGAETRFLVSDELLAKDLARAASLFFRTWTEGPEPAVTIVAVKPGDAGQGARQN
jgi:hypothetical protein